MSPERAQSLTLEAFRRGITQPAPSTLKKYGMTAEEWLELLAEQGWICPICERDAADLKLVTDHEHARGWAKKPDKEKREYTRGVLCAHCNYRKVHSSISAAEAQRIADYIRRYEERRARRRK